MLRLDRIEILKPSALDKVMNEAQGPLQAEVTFSGPAGETGYAKIEVIVPYGHSDADLLRSAESALHAAIRTLYAELPEEPESPPEESF